MRFISCVPVISEDDDTGVVLCQAQFSEDRCDNLKNLQHIYIKELIASEGSEIAAVKNVSFEKLHCFSHADALKSWYELLDLLSAGFFRLDMDRSWTEKAQWRFYYVSNTWKLAFETQVRGLTKRFCELELVPAREKEVDLFEMSMKLYQNCVTGNQKIHRLEQRCKDLQNLADESQKRQDEDHKMIKKRDERTRAFVINLLNEKKAMIRKLQRRLEENRAPEDIPDGYLVNRFVSQPVSRMTSPRKRTSLRKSGTPSPKKRTIKSLVKEEEEDQWDDFGGNDVEILGINRERTVSTPNLRLETPSLMKNPFLDETRDLNTVKEQDFASKEQLAPSAGSAPCFTLDVSQKEESAIPEVAEMSSQKEEEMEQETGKAPEEGVREDTAQEIGKGTEEKTEEDTEQDTEEDTEEETEVETDA